MPRLQTVPWKWLVLSISLAILDQYIKAWAVSYLSVGDSRQAYFLIFRLCYNPGIGFGLLVNTGKLLLLIMIVSTALLLKKLVYFEKHAYSSLNKLGLACVLAGGLGNIYDRFRLGAIIDFICINCLYWKTPVFNFADVLIIIGFSCIIFQRNIHTCSG